MTGCSPVFHSSISIEASRGSSGHFGACDGLSVERVQGARRKREQNRPSEHLRESIKAGEFLDARNARDLQQRSLGQLRLKKPISFARLAAVDPSVSTPGAVIGPVVLLIICAAMVAVIIFASASAAERMAGPVAGQVIRVIDGDTLEIRAKIWLGQEITVKVRVAKVNAPELSRPRCAVERQLAEKSKALVEDMIGPGAVRLRNIHYGKYAGRVVADVETGEGDIATALQKANLSGGNWCQA